MIEETDRRFESLNQRLEAIDRRLAVLVERLDQTHRQLCVMVPTLFVAQVAIWALVAMAT